MHHHNQSKPQTKIKAQQQASEKIDDSAYLLIPKQLFVTTINKHIGNYAICGSSGMTVEAKNLNNLAATIVIQCKDSNKNLSNLKKQA